MKLFCFCKTLVENIYIYTAVLFEFAIEKDLGALYSSEMNKRKPTLWYRPNIRAGRQCINFLYRVLAYEFIWEKIRKKSWRKNFCSISNQFLRILTFVNFTHINSKKIQLVYFLTDFDETTFKEYCSSRRFRKWGHMSKSVEK